MTTGERNGDGRKYQQSGCRREFSEYTEKVWLIFALDTRTANRRNAKDVFDKINLKTGVFQRVLVWEWKKN